MRSAWSVASERIIIPRLDSLTDQSGIRGKADQVYLGGNLLENVNILILMTYRTKSWISSSQEQPTRSKAITEGNLGLKDR